MNIDLPAPRVALIDVKTGAPTREFYLFLVSLLKRVGEGSNDPLDDIVTQLAAVPDASGAVSALARRLDDIAAQLAAMPAPTAHRHDDPMLLALIF